MGRIGKVLSFLGLTREGANVRDVKTDPGGGINATSEHFADPGDDSHPLPGDYAATVSIMRRGISVAVGYVDPKNDNKAAAGEKRIYSRDAGGAMIAEIWLKNDGSVICDNGAGSFELQASGDFVVNGVTIDTGGNIIAPADVTVTGTVEADTLIGTTSVQGLGKELAIHTHPILSGSSQPGPTGPNT